MVGKDPHRPEGKTRDAEHMHSSFTKERPYVGPSAKELLERDRLMMEGRGSPTRLPAEEQFGGSRPGVESRVKDAIAIREAREDEA